jgi:hypothetical protein
MQALGCEFHAAWTDGWGAKGEFFFGQTLAEDNAGALQNFTSRKSTTARRNTSRPC